MTKEMTPSKIGPRAVTSLRQTVVLPGEPTPEPEFYNTLAAGETMDVTSGSCLIVRNGDDLQEVLFLEDEIIRGPLAYVNRGERDHTYCARKAVQRSKGEALFIAAVFGVITLVLVAGELLFSWPADLSVLRNLSVVFVGAFSWIALYIDQYAKRRPASALRRNYRTGPLTVKFPANAQPVD